MNEDEIYLHDKLSDYCRRKQVKKVKEFLKKNENKIDILYDEGDYFNFAFCHENYEMAIILLSYFENVQLKNASSNLHKELAIYKLANIIDEAISSYDLSNDILSLFEKYLPDACLRDGKIVNEQHEVNYKKMSFDDASKMHIEYSEESNNIDPSGESVEL